MASSKSDLRQRRTTTTDAPVLVVGATGKVGRCVVQQLLSQNHKVRALVRNPTKAREVLAVDNPNLELVVADLGQCEHDALDKAVQGCSAIISVSGATRLSKLTDFVPWRLFQTDVSAWADRDHPYFVNYASQKVLLELAQKHNIRCFVRLTGMSLAFGAFHPFCVLMNTFLSMTVRYHALCEAALATSSVPYVILRPGRLLDTSRTSNTRLQVDARGILTPPRSIGRDDVAALGVAAVDLLPASQSWTLACRWVGDDDNKDKKSAKEVGHATAVECLQELVQSIKPVSVRHDTNKPYGVAVALVVYPILGAGLWIVATVGLKAKQLIVG